MPPRHYRRAKDLLVVGALVGLVALVVLPIVHVAREKNGGTHEASRRHLWQLGTALLSYSQDHDGRLPPMRDVATVRRALGPYVTSSAIFTHPVTGEGYRPNPMLSHRRLSELPQAGQVVAFYEVRPGEGKTRGVTFADGRSTRVHEREWPRLKGRSGIP